jgi:cytochrome b6-f complex iron-sulfur subunit
MEPTTIFIIGIASAAVLAAAAVFTVAFRRGPDARPVSGAITGKIDKRTIRRDLAARAERPAASSVEEGAVATLVDEARIDEIPQDAAPDPLLERVELSVEEFGIARRQFFNRAILGLFGGAFMGGLGISFLAFLWPKLSGGFGSPIPVGTVEDLRRDIAQSDGTFIPKFVAAAQAWIVPFTAPSINGTSFEGLPVLAGDEGGELGLMALWQRCVHLGCRVPACISSQGFECPCHGSKYNMHGEYQDGPAPRNLDRFAVEVNDRDELIVLTGEVFQTARAKVKTVAWPQGPNCL